MTPGNSAPKGAQPSSARFSSSVRRMPSWRTLVRLGVSSQTARASARAFSFLRLRRALSAKTRATSARIPHPPSCSMQNPCGDEHSQAKGILHGAKIYETGAQRE